jgi:hypothetical protein
MTQSTKVARQRGHDRKRYDQDSVVQETQKGLMFGKRMLERPKMQNGNKGPWHKTAAASQDREDIRADSTGRL